MFYIDIDRYTPYMSLNTPVIGDRREDGADWWVPLGSGKVSLNLSAVVLVYSRFILLLGCVPRFLLQGAPWRFT